MVLIFGSTGHQFFAKDQVRLVQPDLWTDFFSIFVYGLLHANKISLHLPTPQLPEFAAALNPFTTGTKTSSIVFAFSSRSWVV
jgi:hypothetical protein